MSSNESIRFTVSFASRYQYCSSEIAKLVISYGPNENTAIIEHLGRRDRSPLLLLKFDFGKWRWKQADVFELSPNVLINGVYKLGLTHFGTPESDSRLGRLINQQTQFKYHDLRFVSPMQELEPDANYCFEVTEADQIFEGRWVKTEMGII